MAFYDPHFGLQRRGLAPPDPYSEEARFPALYARNQQAASDTLGAVRDAGLQHAAALMSNPGSIAARNDPLQYGSMFSQQFGGAYDAMRDSERQQNPASGYYGGLTRRSSFTQPAADTQPDAATRYAQGMGYMPGGQTYAQQYASPAAGSSTVFDPKAPGYMRPRKTSVTDFGVT